MDPNGNLKKLRVERSYDAWHRMNFGRIPYDVHYGFGFTHFPGIDERNPAMHRPTPNLGSPSQSLSIWVHRSVPRKFVEFVLYHELVEAEAVLADNIPLPEAHQRAVEQEKVYVERFYGNQRLTELQQWQREKLDGYS